MARRTVSEGAEYTYSGENPIGADAGALVPGTKITVRETVLAGEKGAHNDTEDSVVILWDAPALVQGANGVEVGYTERAMSISAVQFAAEFTGTV